MNHRYTLTSAVFRQAKERISVQYLELVGAKSGKLNLPCFQTVRNDQATDLLMWKKVGAWNQAQAEANGYEGRPDAAQVVDQAGSRTSCQPGPRGRSEARHLRDVQFVSSYPQSF